MSSDWRVIAQRILTGEFLSYSVPLQNPTTSRELSGPGGVFGTIEPELRDVIADDGRPLLEEWSTALYVEEDGQLRGGGIVQAASNKKSARVLEAPGFSSYPTGVPYAADYRPTAFEDPVTVFRNLWSYVQSFPDANLGVKVNGPSTYMLLTDGAGPYSIDAVDWRDCGNELNNIAKGVPFDYLEQHTWNADHTAIAHDINVGFPRFGRKRDDLVLADGANVHDFSAIGADGTRYANVIYGLGNGSGRGMLTSTRAVRDGRLRRPAVVPFKAASQGVLDTFTATELRSRELKVDISELTVSDHPNARLSAITPGDDILADVNVPWLGRLQLWLRVLAIQETGNIPGVAVLKTQRSDFFNYASGKSLTGDPLLIAL